MGGREEGASGEDRGEGAPLTVPFGCAAVGLGEGEAAREPPLEADDAVRPAVPPFLGVEDPDPALLPGEDGVREPRDEEPWCASAVRYVWSMLAGGEI